MGEHVFKSSIPMNVNVLLDSVGKDVRFLQVTAVKATLANMAVHAETLLKRVGCSVNVLRGIGVSSVKLTSMNVQRHPTFAEMAVHVKIW